MQLYLIRHGQSTNNALGEEQDLRVHDPPLTEAGEQQAQLLAEYFKTRPNFDNYVVQPVDASRRTEPAPFSFTHLYCSAMHRAMQTAKPIAAALEMDVEIWVDVHEFGGIFLNKDGVTTGYGGYTRQQIEDEFTGYIIPETVTEQGWWKPESGREEFGHGVARALRVAKDLKDRAADKSRRDERIAIVAHGGFLDALLKTFQERIPASGYYQWLYNTSVTRLDFTPEGRILFRYMNRVDHLPPELVT